MVQFVFTPWRNRSELLRVRDQFYPSTTTTNKPAPDHQCLWSTCDELDGINKAIARVFMWVHRGHCPHVVESTALLMAAIVFDERGDHDAVAGAAVRAGYLMAFTRFVTGLLDSHQDKVRKLSMYGVAKTIGLPASFVELRHQGTHEPMPPLTQLRPAARKALVWIWEYYWKNLSEGEGVEVEEEEEERVKNDDEVKNTTAGGGGMSRQDVAGVATTSNKGGTVGGEKGKKKKGKEAVAPRDALKERMCRASLMGYLQRQEGGVGGDAAREGLMRQLQNWDAAMVVGILAEIGGTARDKTILLRSVKLLREILGQSSGPTGLQGVEGEEEEDEEDEEELRKEIFRARDDIKKGGQSTTVTLLGKRKKGEEEEEAEEEDSRYGKGWFQWKGPWIPRPIGII